MPVLAVEWGATLTDWLLGGVAACAILGCATINGPSHSSGGAGRELTIPVGSYNQCETDISANGHSFHGLLDFGASGNMTFGRNHAKALGYDLDKLSFNDGSYEFANGTGHYARVTLKEVRIGNWSLRDVPAEITQASQSEVLIGLEILHPLNFHLSGSFCHLSLPQATVAASLHPAPSAPLRTDIQPARRETAASGPSGPIGKGTGGLY